MSKSEAELAAYARGLRHGWAMALAFLDISAVMSPAEGLGLVRRQLQELADALEAELGPLDEEDR